MLSRKPQKAVRPTDPGQSAWWLLPPVGGITIGAMLPYLATQEPAWAAAGGAIGAAAGGLASATPQFREWISARSHRQEVASTTGISEDIRDEPLESLRVHHSDRDITEFVPRDIQEQLVERLSNGAPILIEGPSMSGKTRLAIETIRSHWPDSPLWFPRDDDSIQKLLDSNQQPTPQTVIFLDDIDRFLSNQSLTLSKLTQWINNSCTIIATMMHSQYVKHSDRSNEKAPGWDVLNRFDRITLSPTLSKTELNATELTSYANQLTQIKNIGLGPLLGCAEAVRTAFADELERHSWCGALIKAAADWRRIGLGPASREQLTTFSLAHKNDAWETVDWDDAWKRATRLVNHAVPLLRRVGEDRWEILDTIADEADWKISEHTFTTLQNITLSAQQARQTALTMFLQCASPSSTNAMFQRAIDADPTNANALLAYATYLDHFIGHKGQARDMYQRAIDADPTNANALCDYAEFLREFRGDMDNAEQMYQRAIDADPTDARTLRAYAGFLHTVRSDIAQAEQMYQRALDAEPTDARTLHAYAEFLREFRGDMNNAEQMYQRAIDADPTNANALHAYAFFLHRYRGDMVQAEQMYQRAIDADPTNATFLVIYVCFLESVHGNMDQAEQMYQRAIDADPTNATLLGDYAKFLHTVRHNADQAGQMYLRALDADPANTTFLVSYIFLHHMRGDNGESQEMHQRALDAVPTNATALGAYAFFLHRYRGDMVQAEQMYQRALDADPTNATALHAYAGFLQQVGDTVQAEQMYQRAIDADPTNARILCTYGNFLTNIRGDIDQAQDLYQWALDANPTNTTALSSCAQLLFAKSDDMKAISLAEKTITLACHYEKSLLAECHFYLFAHSPKHRKESGKALKTLLAEGVTTGDWSFEMNLERLRREEGPRLELLETVARTLEDGNTSRLDAFEEWRDL